ncbi:colicin V production protein [Bradyrhizobiaceae bacterium SG-6C]|nr:colicin V production protein [Bradyrhizobiaceae bacterium SG-6C]
MNTFDIVVSVVAIVAMITGFRTGLIRSMATILGYISAAPLAVAGTSLIAPIIAGQTAPTATQNSVAFFALFLGAGLVLGYLLRLSVDEIVGPVRSIPDRITGSILGLVRTALIAVTIVLVFDRIIPPGRDPAYLMGSKLRPLLSQAGQRGLKSLPPETMAYIDQLKRGQRS